ncbi:MAG: molybdenum ABC transporter ATP-binding protein [Nitrospirales bacterium]|nr:molybdenum ABC transporter ATP-binding protein [Nitrospira sp.]MDR4502440.1 molybdenum ABC transporter ATP-binding protein [Nitrospirales bacterium]
MNTLAAQFDVQYPDFQFVIDVTLPLRGVTVVFGPSGCGKTTFLRCLAGLERSPNGVLRVGRATWQDEAEGVFLPISKRPLGYVFQEPRLFPHLSVRSNLAYGLKRTEKEKQNISFEKIIALLDLQALLDRRPHGLSGGEQQRVAIGRALLTSPELLLMDEPLSSLDVRRKREILPFIHRLDAELHIPIIYVTHSLQEVLQLATTLVMLKDGRVAGIGPLREVFSQLDSRSFLEESHIGAVIDAKVDSHDTEFGLTKLTFGGRHLYVPRQDQPIGQGVRVQILSRDVSIVTSPPAFQSSVLNILEATVLDVGTLDPQHPFVDIKLDIGWPLLATITRKSLTILNLKPGQRVYAQIKAVAFSQDRS